MSRRLASSNRTLHCVMSREEERKRELVWWMQNHTHTTQLHEPARSALIFVTETGAAYTHLHIQHTHAHIHTNTHPLT